MPVNVRQLAEEHHAESRQRLSGVDGGRAVAPKREELYEHKVPWTMMAMTPLAIVLPPSRSATRPERMREYRVDVSGHMSASVLPLMSLKPVNV